jgi:hypothetical protein
LENNAAWLDTATTSNDNKESVRMNLIITRGKVSLVRNLGEKISD